MISIDDAKLPFRLLETVKGISSRWQCRFWFVTETIACFSRQERLQTLATE